jgi:hypothetical protein
MTDNTIKDTPALWKAHATSKTSPIEQSQRKEVRVPSPKLLFLLFWVKGKFGDALFTEAPKTRMHNIKRAKWYNEKVHEVHCIDIEDLSDIIDVTARYIERFGGKSKVRLQELSVHSHAGQDGPIGSVDYPKKFSFNTTTEAGQMTMDGWKSIDFNWNPDNPRFVIYGCDSALEDPPEDHPSQVNYKNFAQSLSSLPNLKNVEVWGQSTKSTPSYLPDFRVTSLDRDIYSFHGTVINPAWRIGPVYQIAAHIHGGLKATATPIGMIRTQLEDREYVKRHFDPAMPMNCYKNGQKIHSQDQGCFNDHRTKA